MTTPEHAERMQSQSIIRNGENLNNAVNRQDKNVTLDLT